MDGDVIDLCRRHLAEALDGIVRSGAQVPQLRELYVERLEYRRSMEFQWRLADGRRLSLVVPDRLGGWPDEISRPLIEMYREEFIRLTGNQEAYVPDPEYRYPLRQRLRADGFAPDDYVDAEAIAPLEMRTTRDPFHAEAAGRDPEDARRARQEQAQVQWGQARQYWAQQAMPENVRRRMRELEAQMQAAAMPNAAIPALGADGHRPTAEALRAAARLRDRVALQGNDTAAKRGWELLRENLTEVQRTDLDAEGHFWVTGGETGTIYLIATGKSYNIHAHRMEEAITRVMHWKCKVNLHCKLCFAPDGGLCTGDVMLTQKVALELREGDALAKANFKGSTKWLEKFPEIFNRTKWKLAANREMEMLQAEAAARDWNPQRNTVRAGGIFGNGGLLGGILYTT